MLKRPCIEKQSFIYYFILATGKTPSRGYNGAQGVSQLNIESKERAALIPWVRPLFIAANSGAICPRIGYDMKTAPENIPARYGKKITGEAVRNRQKERKRL